MTLQSQLAQKLQTWKAHYKLSTLELSRLTGIGSTSLASFMSGKRGLQNESLLKVANLIDRKYVKGIKKQLANDNEMNVNTEISRLKQEVEDKRLARVNTPKAQLASSNTGWAPSEPGHPGGSGSDPDSDPSINTPTADNRADEANDDTLAVLGALNDLLQQASALVQKAKANRSGTTAPTDQKFERFLVDMTPSERSRWLANPENRKLVFQK